MHKVRRSVFLLVVLLVLQLSRTSGAQEESQPWKGFAMRHYVDRSTDKSGRYTDGRKGWKIKRGRAPGSLVISDKATLPSSVSQAIQSALSNKEIPKGITIPPQDYEAWQSKGGEYLITFCMSAPGDSPGTYEIWDEKQGKLIETPAYEHFVQATLWVKGLKASVITEDISFDQDVESYGCHWDLQDIVDIDKNGQPEVVLVERGYESEELKIFTIDQGTVIYRWGGLGYGL